ncbi:MAG: hypothetical protein JWM27_2510 [Gemmatimonadetes bacterium]|nr:hypothetical protein [Gemmatimonadota bacterium]
MDAATPDEQLEAFIQKYTPEIGAFARDALARMRARLPGAVRMVYDNYNALVIGFGPNERPSDAIFSLVMFPRYVSVCFLQGAGLPDPDRLLQGGGSVVRHVRLSAPDDLQSAPIEGLIATALAHARVPMPATGEGRLVIRSVSAKQRPRRPAP